MDKKIAQYALVIAASLGLAACSADDFAEAPENMGKTSGSPVEMYFAVTMEGAAPGLSKASLSMDAHENMLFSFSEGDSLSVFGDDGKKSRLDYAGIVENASCFSGTVSGNTFYALFPGQPGARISGKTITAQIASEISGHDFSPISVAMATKNSPRFELKNACSMLWIDGKLDSYKKIVVESNKNIAGTVSITVSDNSAPVVSEGTSSRITISNPETGIVAVAPSENADITLTFFRQDGSSFVKQYKGLDLQRSQAAFLSVADGHFVNFSTGVDGSNIPSISVSENTDFEIPDCKGIVNPGLNFLGWENESSEIFTAGSICTMGSSDINLTALWTDKFVLTYKVEGKRLQSVELFQSGDTFVLGEAPAREGYTFVCWLSNGVEYNPGAIFKPIGNTTVTAVYEPCKYTISVDANGGKFGGIDKKMANCYAGTPFNVESEIGLPIRDGYDFGGYYDNPEFSGSPVKVVQNPSASATLYAKWYKIYTISYVTPDGEPILKKNGEPLVSFYSSNTYCITIESVNGLVDSDKWFSPNYNVIGEDGKVYGPTQAINVSTLDELKDMVFTLEVM